jgi:WD40 repeat protein/serine/threonine protein kinase
MIPQAPLRPTNSSIDPALADLVEELTAKLQAGEAVDADAILRAHPEHAEQLRQLLPALEMLVGLSGSREESGPAPDSVAGTLGDFRILREVGRGGMGIVYEAEQISLGRRVALKVLPFAGALDPKRLQRFKTEAQAAAHLQHQHIVPVYYVGCERGVHFYAMQFIEGHTLAAVIRDLRQLGGPQAPAGAGPTAAAGSLAGELASGRWAPAQRNGGDPRPTTSYAPDPGLPPTSPAEPPTAPAAALSTERSTRSTAFFRTAAHLGVQAAEALEHAHGLGVLHRDVKPANLMVNADGRLWVTDFGLARLGNDAGLTMTGDLLGTLRYMSPEQALAGRVAVDGRTDVYSLGVTLYELLTLEPAYNGRSREEVLRQVAFEEPRPPRKLNPAVPAELETIVLKAMAKAPEERYATAQELADDLRRYLDDKPIKAKRPSLRQRAAKWARRHKTLVRAAVVLLVLAVAGLAAGTLLVVQEQARTAQVQAQAATDLAAAEAAARKRLETELYFQRIALAEREWEANNLGRMQRLLDECPEDLRGWEWYYLKRLPRGGLPPRRHSGALTRVAISPDGQRIASSSQDGFVTVWDAQKGQKLFPSFKAHEGAATSVAFSPDGHLLATGGQDVTVVPLRGTVIVWDAKTGQLLRKLGGHSAGVSMVAFSPDGQRLASVGWVSDDMKATGEMKVWDVTTGQLLLTVLGHEGRMTHVAFSPDGKRLATSIAAGRDSTVEIWDAQTGEEQRSFRGHSQGVSCVAFSPDGRLLASAGGAAMYPSEQDVKVWDGETRQELFTLRGHLGSVRGVAFSPDGRRLASAGVDRTVKLWDVATGKEALTLRGHFDTVSSVAFSRDGRQLVSASVDQTVRVWDGAPVTDDDPNCLTLPGPGGACTSVAFHPKDQRLLAAAYRDGNVRVWDLSLGKPRCFATLAVDQDRGVYALAFSPKGQWLAAVSGNTLKVWNATTYQEVRTIPGEPNFACVAFSPDEQQVAAAGYSNSRMLFPVRVWDVANDKEPQVLSGNNWAVFQVAFSPDGQHLASAGMDGTVRIWDVKTRNPIDVPPLTTACPSHGLAFSPDGKQLAVGSNDQVLRIWDTTTWKLRHEYRNHGGMLSVAFSPDGQRLAWGSTDSTVKVWDLTEGRAGGGSPQIHVLHGHVSWVLSVAFRRDGQQIASASADGTVKIWKAPLP